MRDSDDAKKEKVGANLLKEIMAKTIPNMVWEMIMEIHEIQRTRLMKKGSINQDNRATINIYMHLTSHQLNI
jgi:hypothetical protein